MRLGEFESATREYLNIYFSNSNDLSTANLAILTMVGTKLAGSDRKSLIAGD